jgi:polyribonucleotide nucleotidyltransferase
MDQENDADTLAMIGASAALEISDIPFTGPIACVRVGRIDGEFRTNPTIRELEKSDLNIIVAGSKTGVVMVEGGASFINEKDMIDAIFHGHREMQPIIALQEKLREAIGVTKRPFSEPERTAELVQKIDAEVSHQIRKAVSIAEKVPRNAELRRIKSMLLEGVAGEHPENRPEADAIFEDLKKQVCREMVLKQGRRIDGRAFDEIRPISIEIGLLPRTHGSALFSRGETQVLGVLTLGSGPDEQRVETLTGDESRQFMLHYNFPPFSVGEVRRLGGPSRRDIGHGGLSTRALERIMPPKESFDYTVRVVSEVLESNGSSSMGTVCAGTLALMDGGVPISAPVAGIAMGLVKEGDQVVILSDILGDEDHTGDMDFKVTGTHDGITALQMDIKIHELPREILENALERARVGRLFILDKMNEVIREPRKEMSPYAPKVTTIKINPDKIREVIGPGGKVIRAIQTETDTQIEIEESGLVKIASSTREGTDRAVEKIREITREPEVGAIYEGPVVKTTDFGAFVQILPGTDGLVHISQLSKTRVKKVTDVVKEGDLLKVKVLEITRDGKIRLSHKSLLEDEE